MEKTKKPQPKNSTPQLHPDQLKRLESDKLEKLKDLNDRNVVNK